MIKKIADRLFKWYCHPDYYPDIAGDLEELYQDHLNTNPRTANRKYLGDVLLLFRPALVRPILKNYHLNQLTMFRNHFKIALRITQHEKSFTAINVLGLALGMAIALLIVQFVRFELSYESMYPKADKIVRLTMDILDGGTLVDQDCETYPPIGPKITEEVPEVVGYARTYNLEEITNLKVGEKHFFTGRLYAADSSLFDLFDLSLTYGTRQGLFSQPYQVVLTESRAKALFDRLDVVGEMIEIRGDGQDIPFKVVGVIPDSPPNTHLKYDMLISFQTLAIFGEEEDNWNGNNTYTFIELAPQINLEQFESKLATFNQRLLEEELLEGERIAAQPIKDIHLYSNKSFEPEPNGDAQSVFLLLGVAILVILIAFVNYINLATSRAMDRAKEVGIRKVAGSSVAQLRGQFLVESFLINLLAGVVALLLMLGVKGYFLDIAVLPADFVLFGDPLLWMLLGLIIILGSLLAGAYPAFVLSSFKIATVLKGKYAKTTKGSLLRRGLVVLQFAITIVLLAQTLTISEQLEFMRKKDLGVEVERTIVVRMPPMENSSSLYQSFKEQMLTHTNVQGVSNSDCVPGLPGSEMGTTTGINPVDALEKHNYNFYLHLIDTSYVPVMGIELLSGKNFDQTSDVFKELIVNEEAIRLWNYPNPEDAIGQKVKFWGEPVRIRGVIKNYHQESAKSAHIPMILIFSDGNQRFTSVKLTSGDAREHLKNVEEVYNSIFTNRPFSYFFLDEQYDQQFKADEKFQQVFSILTGFAIIIACLGLFGLASFVVAKRTKEIGIRKVIGASSMQIMVLLSNDFVKTILIAILLAVPVSYYLVSNWLLGFAFRIDMNPWLVVLPAVLVIILALLSLSIKTINTSLSNPVDSLRDE